MRRRPHLPTRDVMLWLACLTVLVLAVIGQLVIGRSGMSPAEAVSAMLGEPQRRAHAVILELRVPRVLAGALAGAALGVAGVLLRFVTGNPLAEPGLLGISSGAALGVVTADLLGMQVGTTLAALLGAGLALLLISVAAWGRWSDRVHLVLCGVLVGSILMAATTGVLAATARPLGSVLRWLVGSLNGVTEDDVSAALVPAALGVVVLIGLGRSLGTTRLPDTTAHTVGAMPGRTRALVTLAAIALTTASVLAAGAVAFLGLAAPEVARRVLGTTTPARLLPAAALTGAALLVAADLVALRTTVSVPWSDSTVTGIPVGALLAPAIAPFLILALLDRRSRA